MAADDLKTKKRKVASEAAPKPKKQKKSDEVPAAAPSKPAKASKAVAAPITAPTTKVKPARKRAEDFFDDEDPPKTDEKPKKKAKKNKEPVADVALEADDEASKPRVKKAKKAKQPEHTEAPAVKPDVDVDDEEATGVNLKKQKKTKTPKKQQKIVVEEKLEVVADGAAEDDEEDLDDQTAALLAGFESERDESDLEKEDQDLDEDVAPKLTKKQQKALQNIRKDSEPAVVYVGRIPHGFFEPQMKKYFSQFGDITRLRLSRNKKTGASKHYAFIEFRHGEVADIVAKTMNNYIMFGHILQCRVVPSEQIHEDLFKGANQRFKVDPRNKKAGNAMKNGASRAAWANRVERENENRAKKAKALKSEFNYTFEAPAVKPVASVPSKTLAPAEDADQQLLEDTVPAKVIETVKARKPKKGSTSKGEDETAEKDDEDEQPAAKTKAKKEKKLKSDVSAEQPEENAKAPRAKKAKKAVDEEAETVVPEKKRKTKNADQDGAKPKKAKKAKA